MFSLVASGAKRGKAVAIADNGLVLFVIGWVMLLQRKQNSNSTNLEMNL
jgi:hypothetical protein